MRVPIKVVLVTDLNVYGEGYARFQAMKQVVSEVHALPMAPIGGADRGYVESSLLEKLVRKAGFEIDTEKVNAALLAKVTAWRPDVVWIDKGNMIYPTTLARVRRAAPRALLASYAGDDMFAWHNRTWFYKWGLKHYDVVFTTKSNNADPGELPSFGARRVVFVNNAYEPTHHPLDVTEAERAELGSDVGFIGSFEASRFEAMLFLAEHGVRVRVWGNNWHSKIGVHPNLMVEGKALVNTDTDLRYTKGICSTRINLGFLRKINRDLQTARSVEIPACAAFLLAERTDEHRRLFEEGREAEFFASNEELLAKTQYYLAHDAERAAIAEAGRQRCLASGYSQLERMQTMVDEAVASKGGQACGHF
jgi:spore maturation protein CgeB